MMKKMLGLCVIIYLVLCLAGCIWTLNPVKGIRIVGIGALSGNSFRTSASTKGAGTIMRDRYVFSYPENSAAYMLVAEDLEGNILTEGVEWSLQDPTLGQLIPEPTPNEYIQCFQPKKAGETIVIARTTEASDTAQIVVYPGWGWNSGTFPGIHNGFDFSTGQFITDETESDIWWPGNSVIRFKYGYWTDTNLIAIIDNLDTLTAEGKELILGETNYTYYTDTDQLFLVKTKEGAIYAAILMCAKLVYKPIPLIPAP